MRQAQREERCAGRAHAMWLEDEAGWWAILAAAAAAATTADGRAGPAATSAGTNGASDRDGGGDGGGPGTGGDVTPQPGQSHGGDEGRDHRHGSGDSNGSEESDGNSTSSGQIGGGGDVTPPAVSTRWCRSWMWAEERADCWVAHQQEKRCARRSRSGVCRRRRPQQAGSPLLAAAGLAEVVGWAAGPSRPPAATRWSHAEEGTLYLSGGGPAAAGASRRPSGGRPSVAVTLDSWR